MNWISKFLRDEEGATMVEYGILVALISVVAIGAISVVGGYVGGAFDKTQSELEGSGIDSR